jgi:hypothetical protein
LLKSKIFLDHSKEPFKLKKVLFRLLYSRCNQQYAYPFDLIQKFASHIQVKN